MTKSQIYFCPIPLKPEWTKLGHSIHPVKRLTDIFGAELLSSVPYKIFNVTSDEFDALTLERVYKQTLKPHRIKRSLVCKHSQILERSVPHTEVFKLSIDNLLTDLDDLVYEHTTLV